VEVPRAPGTYVLFLALEEEKRIRIGRKGEFVFPAGVLAYVGSARGPGGLAARLARHRRDPKPQVWHVDFLRPFARPIAVWWAPGPERRECFWAGMLARMPGASQPVPRFGASDCRCPAHLVHFPTLPDREAFAQAVGDELREEKWT
jgi:Uri superfamily endonuclease